MGPKIKTKTIYAKVLDRKIVTVEISIHSECIQRGQSSKENKANISKMFSKEHFDRLILKLQDVILAKVLAPSETVDKKKSAKTSCCDNAETLPDPELSIQYQFVRKRNYKQTALIRQKQESVVDDLRKNSQQCGYSGGGYRSYNFFPQKLNVTVSLASQVAHQMPALAAVAQDAKDQPPAPSKSTISKYFNKDSDTLVTRSTQKKRTALKNMNKKNCDESQKRIDSLLCSNSSVCEEVDLKEKQIGKATSSVEPVSDTQHKLDKISWVNEHGNKVKIEDVLPFQEGVSSTIKTEDKPVDNDILLRHEDESERAPNDSSENSSITSGFSPKGEEFKANLSNEDVDSDRSGFSVKKEEFKPRNEDVEARKQIKTCENVSSSKELDVKSTESTTGKFKRRRFHESESDSADAYSIPSLRLRLSKKTTLNKPKTVPGEETEGKRKETDSISVRTGDDNDFESPKARRNTGKRKGSDLSDDQDLLTSVFSTSSESAPSSSRDAKEGLNSRKRKTKKTDTKGDVSKRMIKNQPKRRIYKRKVRDTAKTTADALEDAGEEPGSSPLEPITIEDKPPMTIDVSAIEELTAEQTEYLVLEHASKLREIFEGKKYCRRHEDYKKGGKMKGDLAFQVQFGPFSEAQRDRIMEVLTNMFCYRHSKYFDYVSKVLLPETLVMLYMKVEGKTREEAELLLLEAPTSTT